MFSEMSMKKRTVLILSVSVLVVFSGALSYLDFGENQPDRPKTAVIVLDGMDWKPVHDLREEERVPHMSQAMEEGVYANFSTPRAFSPVTWTKIGTGQDTENVNIDGWNVEDDGSQRMIQSQDVKNRRVWNYLNDANISTGVVGWMVTWPVEEVKGYMISGPLATSDRDLVYPEGRFEEDMDVIKAGKEWKIAHAAINKTKDENPFIALGFKNLDTYQHQLWKYMEPEKFGIEESKENDKYREFIYAEYEELDRLMGRFGDDWNVIVIGDSGFDPEMEEYGYAAPTYELDFNPLLEKLGYLELEKKSLKGTEITRPGSESRLKRCPVLYPKNDVVTSERYLYRICVLDDSLDINRTMNHLEEVKYTDGRDFFRSVKYSPEDDSIEGKINIYHDGFSKEKIKMQEVPQPHVSGESYYIDKAVGLRLPDNETSNLWVGPEKTGDHPPGTDFVFMARGPQIADSGEFRNVEVSASDITPSILYLYGLPIPEEMDGEVIEEMFTDGFNRANDPEYVNVSTKKSEDEKPYFRERNETREYAMKERLRDLGYTVQ